jgi:hypothetical protein
MAQDLLKRKDIAAVYQVVGSEGMAAEVRVETHNT